VVVGKAGAGKTFALDVARQAWQRDGHRVIGAALARRAADELEQGAGIESTTIAALLLDLRRDPAVLLDARTALVIDEAGMVGTRQLAELLDHADRAQAKVVLVGDHHQLPEIQAGGVFRGLVTRGHAIPLQENRRQEQTWEREALDLLREGRAGEALDSYQQHGRIHTADTAADVRRRLVADWWASRERGEPGVMLALRRSDVADLNQGARALMTTTGALSGPELTVDERVFRAGDEVVCLKNDRHLGIANGTRGTVTALDPEARTLTLTRLHGRELTLPAQYLDDRTERGGPTVDHGYALTAHKAQGMTTGTAFVLGSDDLYREAGYVALSRGRRENHLYLVDPQEELAEHGRANQASTPITAATRALIRSSAQTMASDAALVSELADRPTDALRAEQHRLRRELRGDDGRQRDLERLARQRSDAERLLAAADVQATASGLPADHAIVEQAARRVATLRDQEQEGQRVRDAFPIQGPPAAASRRLTRSSTAALPGQAASPSLHPPTSCSPRSVRGRSGSLNARRGAGPPGGSSAPARRPATPTRMRYSVPDQPSSGPGRRGRTRSERSNATGVKPSSRLSRDAARLAAAKSADAHSASPTTTAAPTTRPTVAHTVVIRHVSTSASRLRARSATTDPIAAPMPAA